MLRHAVLGAIVSGAVFALVACGSSNTESTPTPTPTDDGGDAGAETGTTVPPGVGMRFVAVGDTGTGKSGQKEVAAAIRDKCSADGCAFVQLLGDNIYEDGVSSADDAQWQEKFEAPFAEINTDFFAVLGNHDYGGDGAGNEFAKGQFEVDYTAKSKKWKLPAAFYHHVKGDMELFALDTNMIVYEKDAQQRTDVAKWISESTAPWKIAVGHHPYLSNGPHGNAGAYDGQTKAPANGEPVKKFFDDVVCGKVDLYLCGHDHSLQWMNESCKGTELAVSGSGAKQTGFLGKNPSLYQSMELGFMYLIVEPKRITIEVIEVVGGAAKVAFTHEIKKP